MKKLLVRMTIILLVLALLTTTGLAVFNYLQDQKDSDAIAEQADLKPKTDAVDGGYPRMDFSDLLAKNSEVVGWITLDGTVIDYPVVRRADNSDDSGNSFYLSRDAEKNTNRNGAIFLDWRNNADFSDFNNIIYGHQTNDVLMFHDLINYKEKAFFDNNQTGLLYTPEKTYGLEIFAVMVVVDTSEMYRYAFVSPSEQNAYVAQIQSNAIYFRDPNLTPKDKIIMLSTCSYEFTDARTVVYAKLIDG